MRAFESDHHRVKKAFESRLTPPQTSLDEQMQRLIKASTKGNRSVTHMEPTHYYPDQLGDAVSRRWVD
jgi:hypothetical protein